MTDSSTENPFDLTKASDFAPDDIQKFWVDFVGESGLLDLLKPTSLQPMLVLGSKGSGKTHLMRYCSAEVQSLRYEGGLLEAVETERFLGVYVRADGLNLPRFRGRGQSEERWSDVFRYYFELWTGSVAINHLAEVFRQSSIARKSITPTEADLTTAIVSLFDLPFEGEFSSFDSLLELWTAEIKKVNLAVSNCHLQGKLDVLIRFSPGNILFGLPDILQDLSPHRKPILLYLIDELENFSDDQQRFVNTLIRYRHGNCSIRIGSRLYGVRTLNTDGSAGEANKRDSEFYQISLDEFVRQIDSHNFMCRLAARRLQAANFFPSDADLSDIAKQLPQAFQEPDSRDHYRDLTLSLLGRFDARERPHIRRLQAVLSAHFRRLGRTFAHREIEDVVTLISDSDYPLLEKVNIFLMYRALHDGEEPVSAAQRISGLHASFKLDPKPGEYYWQLDHYGQDLLAQILRDVRRKPIYAGLDSVIAMSQGIPRNFIAILKHVFQRAAFNGEKPFRGGKISLESQQEGVRDAAEWFVGDAQPDSHGSDVRRCIEYLAELMKEIRYSDKPSECSVSTFSVDFDELSQRAQSILKHAENWSFLIRVRDGHVDKNSMRLHDKYQLNSILAPRWGIAISRRGVIQLSRELAEAIFSLHDRESVGKLISARVSGMNAPFVRTRPSAPTRELF